MKEIIKTAILIITILGVFVGVIVFLTNKRYNDYLKEYENSIQEKVLYEVESYTQQQNLNNGKINYKVTTKSGETFIVNSIKYVTSDENGLFLVSNRNKKLNKTQFFFQLLANNNTSVYSNTLEVRIQGIGEYKTENIYVGVAKFVGVNHYGVEKTYMVVLLDTFEIETIKIDNDTYIMNEEVLVIKINDTYYSKPLRLL